MTDVELPRGAGSGSDVTPLPAASVLLLRGHPYEVLLLRRSEESTFVPGSWVFPGGALEEQDRAVARALGLADEISAMKICAIRETFEESGVWLGASLREPLESVRASLLSGDSTLQPELFRPALERLVMTSRWVTPEGMAKRYDTFFFLAAVDHDVAASADAVEATEAMWITPDEALQRQKRRELPLLFPTLRNLEAIRGFASREELFSARENADIPIMRPLMVVEDGSKKIILPGER